MALCLSGGGFRAALFHLGALRRLNELGVLEKLDTICCVSGGSIIGAALAERLRHGPIAPAAWDQVLAEPFREFTRHNIRTAPILSRLLPRNWRHPACQTNALAERYERLLTKLRLKDLPTRPSFIFCATDMPFGVNWIFERTRAGDWQAGYLRQSHIAEWPLARVVAASSCFPPFFHPMPMGLDPLKLRHGRFPRSAQRDQCIRDLTLSDGGVYDNMGLEPVWKQHQTVLVSDGGAPFEYDPEVGFGRLERFSDIMQHQAQGLRKRWLISSFAAKALEGTYWGIASNVADYGKGFTGYSHELVSQIISRVRTDLDAFAKPEAAVLENHGYLMADAAVATHLPHLLPMPFPQPMVPHPKWMIPSAVRLAMRNSGRRLWLGRR